MIVLLTLSFRLFTFHVFLRHPTIITENFEQMDKRPYEGIIKCKVLPPRRLYHPVLPARFNGKLVFALCRTCAEMQLADCNHSDNERAITGAWVTLELYKAMDLGYEVNINIFQWGLYLFFHTFDFTIGRTSVRSMALPKNNQVRSEKQKRWSFRRLHQYVFAPKAAG
jgi:hypothetical protein